MKSITYTATVNSDHKATIDLLEDIQPGVYTLRVYVEEQGQHALDNPFEGLPTVRAWDWLRDVSLRACESIGFRGHVGPISRWDHPKMPINS